MYELLKFILDYINIDDVNDEDENALQTIMRIGMSEYYFDSRFYGIFNNTIRLLIHFGIDVNYNESGCTALCLASYLGGCDCIDIVKLLIDNGALVSIQSHDGTTSLHDACNDGNDYLAKFLMDNGANPLQVDNKNESAIDCALNQDINRDFDMSIFLTYYRTKTNSDKGCQTE